MIEPELSLAFSMHSNKGIYALLLGSGVSRAAQIPTGWEVIQDLIKKVAALKKEDCQPSPEAWYTNEYGEEPDYSKLLGLLAKAPTERNQVLKGYFEPTEVESSQGIKTPTNAHKAIAKLVLDGCVRVIVTTNFDRLLEKALQELGVNPVVISTPDSIDGALPLTHTDCCIIKVHGDYLDTRMKNTTEELVKYDPRLDTLLDRVFDEYGLVVCGWSAEWDPALRTALERCKNHRFTTFWCSRGDLTPLAKRLVELRRAEVITIRDADSFFTDLAEKVHSLEEVDEPHPLSVKIAASTLKGLLQSGKNKITVFDLIREEAERTFSRLIDERYSINAPYSKDALVNRLRSFEALTAVLVELFVTGCFWADSSYDTYWTKSLERIANPSGSQTGDRRWIDLRSYPALLLIYAGGMAAFTAKKFSTVAALTIHPQVLENGQKHPVITRVNSFRLSHVRILEDMSHRHTPASDYLYEVLREPLRYLIPSDEEYQSAFDSFEYLLGLICLDRKRLCGETPKGPAGRFKWRAEYGNALWKTVGDEISATGTSWPPLQAGLFDSLDHLKESKTIYDQLLAGLPF